MQINIHQAKTQLSRLLELVEQGEVVIIARHGKPVAELIRSKQQGFPFGIGAGEPIAPSGDQWWQPLTESEIAEWIEGQ